MTTQTATLTQPGATITYDVHADEHGDLGAAPGTVPLLIIGSPMTADGFATLVGHFADRPVITYDPRSAGRSPRTDGAEQTRVEEHADDLATLIRTLDLSTVDVFASSGGAVNGLALVQRHPGLVRTLVAHEPPLAAYLPDREEVLATAEAIHRTYQARGLGHAMAKFIDYTMQQGPIPADYPEAPGPDPAMFGMPGEDDGSRDDAMFGQNIVTCGAFEPDLDAVRAGAQRVVIGVGEESGETMAARGARALAQALGTPVSEFPSDHAGFLGGEFGMTGKPDEFAARLREVLDGRGAA